MGNETTSNEIIKPHFQEKPQLLSCMDFVRNDQAFNSEIKVGDVFQCQNNDYVIVEIDQIKIRELSPKNGNFQVRARVIGQNPLIHCGDLTWVNGDWQQLQSVQVQGESGVYGYTPSLKVGDLVSLNCENYQSIGRVKNIMNYRTEFGKYDYNFDIEPILPFRDDQIKKLLRKSRLNNVEVVSNKLVRIIQDN